MITLKKLIILHACSKQVAKFKEVFGDSVVPTEALALNHAHDFDWNWAAWRLLSQEGLAEYTKVIAPAYTEYTNEFSNAEYNAVLEKASAPAYDEYKKASALAFDKIQKTKALLFVRLYLSEN